MLKTVRTNNSRRVYTNVIRRVGVSVGKLKPNYRGTNVSLKMMKIHILKVRPVASPPSVTNGALASR